MIHNSDDKRVLAIQSHVVHGYVGNKAATFPLQLRGWDVDALNVVNFSNHTGYGQFKGYRLDDEQIRTIYEGLKDQDFEYNALLTGYIPSAAAVNAVNDIGHDLKHRYPDLVWLLDPVMGDEGKLYVKDDVVPAYRKILKGTGLVTITTPNYFEVELLTGIKVETKDDVKRALKVLHSDFKIPHVVITSMPHPTDPNKLLSIGSSAKMDSSGQLIPQNPFCIHQTKFDSYFTGTGDLFSALLLDYYTRYGPDNLKKATVATIKSLRKVLQKTWDYSQKYHKSPIRMADSSMRYHELRLVQNLDVILDLSLVDEEDPLLHVESWD